MRTANDSSLTEAVWDVITRRTYDRALAAVELVEQLLHGEGGVRRDGEKLMVAHRDLAQDRDFLPRLARATGLGLALYSGNRRISAATVLDAGTAPEIGGLSAVALADACIRRREPFRGYIDYGGRRYLVVAQPLYASAAPDLAPIGMIEVFQDERAFLDLITAAARAGLDSEVLDMQQRADSMAQVTTFIDDVGRRLQLLALNGNIIAAQAGEHGRAFRVVCRELGALAEQAKLAADEVKKVASSFGDADSDELMLDTLSGQVRSPREPHIDPADETGAAG